MILDRILEHKRLEVAERRVTVPLDELQARIAEAPAPLDFAAVLHRNSAGLPAVIAEVKKASPSRGVIREDFDPAAIARAYESGGASAISVLTDEKFFQGALDYLAAVKEAALLPVLRKDFVIDGYQIAEARAAGADAVLLIAAALDGQRLADYIDLTGSYGMQALVEVHTESELATAVECGASLIGINNRNLHSFEVSLETTRSLIPAAAGKKVVSESGIFTHADMEMLGRLGADAVLIGEALMRKRDVAAKLRELIG